MATQILLVPRKLQQQTPSFQDGISREVETSQRIYGCRLIQKAGVLLRLEAVTVASAQTILHRFYFRKSLKKFDVRLVVMASLLLACKLEEDPRRVKNLIDVVHLLAKAEDAEAAINKENLDDFLLDHDTGEFELTRAEIFRCERYILRELGFMVSQTLVHPHRYILQYIHALCKGDYIPTNKLSQIAWGYLNDSMHTTLCCEVQPAVVAVGSIFLAACDLSIPLAKETGWYELFDVSWEDVVKVCTRILALYKRPPPKYTKLAEAPPVVLPKPVKKEPLPDKTEGKSEEKSAASAATAATVAAAAAAPEAAEDEGRKQAEAEALPQVEEEQQKPLKTTGEAPSKEAETEPPKQQQITQAASSPATASEPPRNESSVSASKDSTSVNAPSSSSAEWQRETRRRSPQRMPESRAAGSTWQRPSDDPREIQGGRGHRDNGSRRNEDSYRSGSRTESGRDRGSPRRVDSREISSSHTHSSSRSFQWERYPHRSRYDGHSAVGSHERRRYDDGGSYAASPRREEYQEDSRSRLSSAKRPARRLSPSRVHKKPSSGTSRHS